MRLGPARLRNAQLDLGRVAPLLLHRAQGAHLLGAVLSLRGVQVARLGRVVHCLGPSDHQRLHGVLKLRVHLCQAVARQAAAVRHTRPTRFLG